MTTIILYLYLLIGFVAAVIYSIYLLNMDEEAFNKNLDYYCLILFTMPGSWIVLALMLSYFKYRDHKKQ